MSKENYIEEIRPHDSAYKHVSGYAEYTDDINEPNNTIYGAIGLSKKAHGIIKNIDLTEVKKSEGVVTVVTQIDIPGRNDVGPVFEGDPIFPKKKVDCCIMRFVRNDKLLAMQLDGRAWTSYILFSNIFNISETNLEFFL